MSLYPQKVDSLDLDFDSVKKITKIPPPLRCSTAAYQPSCPPLLLSPSTMLDLECVKRHCSSSESHVTMEITNIPLSCDQRGDREDSHHHDGPRFDGPRVFYWWSWTLGLTDLLEDPPRKDATHCFLRPIMKTLVVIILHAFAVHYIILLGSPNRSGHLWFTLVVSVDAVTTVIPMDILLLRVKRVRQLTCKLQTLHFEKAASETKSYRWETFTVVATILFLVFYVVALSIIIQSWDIHHMLEAHLPYVQPVCMTELCAYNVVLLVWGTHVMLIWGVKAFLVLFFCFICTNCQFQFECLNKSLIMMKGKADKIEAAVIHDLAVDHNTLCELVFDADNLFSASLFIWFAFVLLVICVEVNSFLRQEKGLISSGGTVIMVLDFLYAIAIVILIVIGGCRVAEVALQTIPYIVNFARSKEMPSQCVYNEVQLIINRVTVFPVTFTVGKFFYITRSILITLVSALCTYIIVLVQMSPQVMESLNSGS